MFNFKRMKNFTIDSNSINARQKNISLNELEQLAISGKVKIVGTQRLFDEMKAYDLGRNKSLNIDNVYEPFIVGLSRIGSAYIAPENDKPSFKQLANILFPNTPTSLLNNNQKNDVMHLVGHMFSSSNYFVTMNTRDFIDQDKASQLEALGILVVTPNEALQIANSL